MKYLSQLAIILLISLVGELLSFVVPLPVPASVYGLVILFILLLANIVKLEQIEDVADFLLLIMPFLFIGPTVGFMQSFEVIRGNVIVLVIMCMLSTFVTTVVTGFTSQAVIRFRKKHQHKDKR